MKKRELCGLLDQLGLHPSRRLGQNFLVDENMLDAMVRAAAPAAGEQVLEIGPGTGVLTRSLLAAGCRVTAVEIDHRLADYLRRELGGDDGFTLIEGDACKIDYDRLFAAGVPYRCLANLPYSCGSVFLAGLTILENPPQEAFILLQKEMGDRLLASPGTKDYGALTVRLAWLYETSLVRQVPPGVFFPPPEVMSVYLRLTARPGRPATALRRKAARLAMAAFAQRRKKAAGLLERLCGAPAVQQAFAKLGIPPDARAENLTPNQYLQLAENLPDALQ